MATSTGNGTPVEMEMNNVSKDSDGSVATSNKGGHGAKGLSVWQAMLFITGEVAGTGVLALPNAILGTVITLTWILTQISLWALTFNFATWTSIFFYLVPISGLYSSWVGIPLLAFFCTLAGYSGVILGRCWIIVEGRNKKYVGHIHNPYQTIALEAYGINAERLVNLSIVITMFGAGTVVILLIAGILKELLSPMWDVSICYWALIVVLVLIPMSWLGTPKDFWVLALAASVTVVIAAIALVVQSIMDIGVHENVQHPDPKFRGFSLAFGAMLFGFGGSAAFPIIQNDMKDRTKFPLAACLGFAMTLSIYAPVAVVGYAVFGNYVQANLAVTVSAGPLRILAQVLLVLHLFCASMTVVNPVFQECERQLGIGFDFGWKRCVARTSIILLMLLLGESIPSFGKILDLIGGSTNTLLVFIFPAVFYMKLASPTNPSSTISKVPLYEKVLMWETIAIGTIGGISSTISAIWEIATPDAFSRPCYLS